MFVFHGYRWTAGRELVGIKTCGSTLSRACSRSFIAYLAKSAAVAYGDVDCSSALAALAIPRLKQAARSLLIFKRRHPLSDSASLGKANFPVTAQLWLDHSFVFRHSGFAILSRFSIIDYRSACRCVYRDLIAHPLDSLFLTTRD